MFERMMQGKVGTRQAVPVLIICLAVIVCTVAGCVRSSNGVEATPSSTPSQTVGQSLVAGVTNVASHEGEGSSTHNPLPDIASVVAKVKPSVVAINVEVVGYDFFNRPIRERGAGLGWIISEDGYIVTNNHVVEGAETVTVTLDDGRVLTARKVSTDPLTDLAVIKVDAPDLPVLEVGDSDAMNIGNWVVAIGNSLGRGISATQGIVSSARVTLSVSAGQTLDDLVQTDAAINPGNSGGPLVNMAGEVIGITSVKVAEVGVEGMGYAISTKEAMPVIAQLIEKGYVVRPSLGVSVATVSRRVAAIYALSVSEGALITEVVNDGPADDAGLKPGDVITAFGGTEIRAAGELTEAIDSKEIGQTVQVTYWRGESKHKSNVTLAESPPPSP
ncbi:MAG: PDZ domain-containing protein [Chloroflexi bacterium]|nr:PDZ domain-containing protein [Chloroflexota bacterium]